MEELMRQNHRKIKIKALVWVDKSTLGEVKREAAVQRDRFLKLDKKQQLLKARQEQPQYRQASQIKKVYIYIYF